MSKAKLEDLAWPAYQRHHQAVLDRSPLERFGLSAGRPAAGHIGCFADGAPISSYERSCFGYIAAEPGGDSGTQGNSNGA
jgi:hypothetical protein